MSTQDDDLDPTGMRALLRGLPDPGPMPDDLVDRIHATLSDLPTLDGGSGSSGVSRGTPEPHRPSWWARNGGRAAIAAVVLIGGGALASGPLGLLSSVERQSNDSSAAADSSAGRAESYSEDGGDAGGSTTSPDLAARRLEATLGDVVVRLTHRDYTAAGLATHYGSTARSPTTPPLTAEAPSIGPIGTEIGVRSCLAALGLPRESAADVDLGSFDGRPAAILVVTLDGDRTAYAVGRDCTTDTPSLLAGPVTLR